MNWKTILGGVLVAASLTLSAPPLRADDIVDTARKAGSFRTLLEAARAANLVTTLKGDGPYTIFAPTDEAFGKIPRETLQSLLRPENREKLAAILTYHVVPYEVTEANIERLKNGAQVTTVNGAKVRVHNRRTLKINDANVLKTDVLADNGVIHVIDTVLMPPMPERGRDADAPRAERAADRAEGDILQTAERAGNFRTLLAAVKAAGLTHTLKEKGPFTLFAPTDEAFAKIPRETLSALLRPENREKLVALLTYHVLSGRVTSEAAKGLRSGSQVATVNGAKITVRNRAGLRVDGARVVQTDIAAGNGIIHVIDAVLMPLADGENCAGNQDNVVRR